MTFKRLSLIATLITLSLGSAVAADAPKPESLIKWRQSAFQVIAWNTGRIKAQLEGPYNKDEVVRAANSIAALANSGLGNLFAANTQTGKGWHDTTVKPEFFSDTAKVSELATHFSREATALAQLAPQAGDAAALKPQFVKLTATCKACHDAFKRSE
ncbi:cytochrome c [Burkholderiaceae bacterium DAT-1]|nr:cytochrome c [Burkholderiaceae bacterium DAT-1]